MSASKRVRFGKARCVRCGGQLYVPGDAPSTIQCGTCSFTDEVPHIDYPEGDTDE